MHINLAFSFVSVLLFQSLLIHVLYTISKTVVRGTVEFSHQQGHITLYYADKVESRNTNWTWWNQVSNQHKHSFIDYLETPVPDLNPGFSWPRSRYHFYSELTIVMLQCPQKAKVTQHLVWTRHCFKSIWGSNQFKDVNASFYMTELHLHLKKNPTDCHVKNL